MNPWIFVLASLAGGLGAALRYLVDVGVEKWVAKGFPWGILIVNITGSFLIGLLVGALPQETFVLGAGLLGGYTTFSTAMVNTVELWRDGNRRGALINGAGMLLLSILAALAGLVLGVHG